MALADNTMSTTYYSPVHVSTLALSNETTFRKAINKLRSNIKEASPGRVYIYRFNIHPGELESAYDKLDKVDERKSIRVTYSDEYNFIIRYMPSHAHEVAHVNWTVFLLTSLSRLVPNLDPPPGCMAVGSTTYQLGPRKKQADSAIQPIPNPSGFPSIVLEVGSSESLSQLKIDAALWLEHSPEIQLVILLSIDPPIPPNLNLPRITIQLWRGFPPNRPICSAAAHQREGRWVWGADWTQGATPLYLLFSDIFRGPAPADYGVHDRVHLNTIAWRQRIVDSF